MSDSSSYESSFSTNEDATEYIDSDVGEDLFAELVGAAFIGPPMKRKKKRRSKKKSSDDGAEKKSSKKKKKKKKKPSSDTGGADKKKSLKKRKKDTSDTAKTKTKKKKKKESAAEPEKKEDAAGAAKKKKKKKKGDEKEPEKKDEGAVGAKKKKKKKEDENEAEKKDDDAAGAKKKKKKKEGDEEDAAKKKKKKDGDEEEEKEEEDTKKKKKKKNDDEDDEDAKKKKKKDDEGDDSGAAASSGDSGSGGGSGGGAASSGGGGGASLATLEEPEEKLEEVEPTEPAPDQKALAKKARKQEKEEKKLQKRLLKERMQLEQEEAQERLKKEAAEKALTQATNQGAIDNAQTQLTQANQRIADLNRREDAIEQEAESEGFNPNDIDGDGVNDEQEALSASPPSVDTGPYYAETPNDPIFAEVSYDENQDPVAMVKKFEQNEMEQETAESQLEESYEGVSDLNSDEDEKGDLELVPYSKHEDRRKGKRSTLRRVLEEDDGLLNVARDQRKKIERDPMFGVAPRVQIKRDPVLLKTLADTYPNSRFFRYSDEAVMQDLGVTKKKKRASFSFTGYVKKLFRDESDTGDGSLSVAVENFEGPGWNSPAVSNTGKRIGAQPEESALVKHQGVAVEQLWPNDLSSPRWIPTVNLDAYQALVLFFAAHQRYKENKDNTSRDAILRVIPMQFWRTMEAVPSFTQAQINAAYDFLRLLAILLVRSVDNRDNAQFKHTYKQASLRMMRDFASILGIRDLSSTGDLTSELLEKALPILRPSGVPLIRDKTPTSWSLERVMEDISKRIDHVVLIEDRQVAKEELDRVVSMLDGLRTTTFYERLGPEKGEELVDLLIGWVRNFGEAVFDVTSTEKRGMAMYAAKQLYEWLQEQDENLAVLWQAYVRYLSTNVQKKEGASQYDNLRVIGHSLDPWAEQKPPSIPSIFSLLADPEHLPSPQEYQRALDVKSVAENDISERRPEDLARSLEQKETSLQPSAKLTLPSMVRGSDKEMMQATDALKGQLSPRTFLVYWCANKTRFGKRLTQTHTDAMDAWIWLRFEAPDKIWNEMRQTLLQEAALAKKKLQDPSPEALFLVELAPLLSDTFSLDSLRTDKISLKAECCKEPSEFMEDVRQAVINESPLRREFVERLCAARFHLAHSRWILHSAANLHDHDREFRENNRRLLELLEESKKNRREQVLLARLYHLVLVNQKHESPAHSILALLQQEDPRYCFQFDDSPAACF